MGDEQKEAEEMIRKQDGSGAYLGGTSNGRGEWKWTDGTPWTAVNPENDGLLGRKETRLAMSSSGKWHDTDGRVKLGVLCREKTEPCEDDDPVLCTSLGMAFCTDRPIQAKCKRTCNVCSNLAPARQDCADNFDAFTCTRYKRRTAGAPGRTRGTRCDRTAFSRAAPAQSTRAWACWAGWARSEGSSATRPPGRSRGPRRTCHWGPRASARRRRAW